MPTYSSQQLADAAQDVQENGTSINQAALKHGVPTSTLSDRLKRAETTFERVLHPASRLSVLQEGHIVQWILQREKIGAAPSSAVLRSIVEAISRQSGDLTPLGKNWLQGFFRRHPEIRTKIGKPMEAKRFDNFTPKAVNWYFDIRETFGWVKPALTFNVDEGGLMLSQEIDSVVIGTSKTRKSYLKSDATRTWVTFIECVSATGLALDPAIIFKGKDLQNQWFKREFRSIAPWHFICSPNGWVDNDIAVSWLQEVFLKQTNRLLEHPGDSRLLILDGHLSHTSEKFLQTCFFNNVIPCFLPSHTSHGLQPLDNGIFNSLKACYRRLLGELRVHQCLSPIKKIQFIEMYAQARTEAYSRRTIQSGWRTTGNWPISRARALAHPEIQQDQPERATTPEGQWVCAEDAATPMTSKKVQEWAQRTPRANKRRWREVGKALELRDNTIVQLQQKLSNAEKQLSDLSTSRKRKKVPNPNQKFLSLSQILEQERGPFSAQQTSSQILEPIAADAGQDHQVEEDLDFDVIEIPSRQTRRGRTVNQPLRYLE